MSSLSEAFLFVFRVNLLQPSNQLNSWKCVSAKSGSESFAKTKTESKTLICCDLLLLCAKNMSCHSQHLCQCVCTAGVVNMGTERCTHSLYFWASSDSDLGCTCWLVSAGIKSLQMIQLKNNEDSLIYQKSVCMCVLTEKQPYCVQVYIIWILCTSTCQYSAYEKVSRKIEASLFCNTCTDVKKVVYTLGVEFFLSLINSITCPPKPIGIITMDLIKTGHTDQVWLGSGWFRSQQCLESKHAP